ncbi:MAG: hypothetical protein K0R71_1626 [Bacillales bacterium]|jgi:hypothetical protein|nr:hypothetical protein [Bacillales bacterium]
MRIILVSVIIFSSLVLIGCQSSNKKANEARKIAWNSLVDSERKEVVGDWKDAKVSKVKVDKGFALTDTSYEGKEMTMVTIRSKNRGTLGDISKLVDEKSRKVVGGRLRR